MQTSTSIKSAELVAEQWPSWLENFVEVYQQLSTDNLALLASIYHQDVVFIDPMHQLTGFTHLNHYFSQLYQNLTTCRFVIKTVLLDEEQAVIFWQMTYQHPKLNGGNPVTVEGNSHIKGQDNKVIYHRDYLDLGAMLYEQLPLLGRVIKWIKGNAAKSSQLTNHTELQQGDKLC